MKSNGTRDGKLHEPRTTNALNQREISAGAPVKKGKVANEANCRQTFRPGDGQGVHLVLTLKELQLLELLSYGYENGDVANHFHTSLQAVKNMLRTINLKLGADNRTHAVAICFRNEWLPLKLGDGRAAECKLPERGSGRRSPYR